MNLHLASLCAVLERGVEPSVATRLLGTSSRRADYAWLEPPQLLGAVRMTDAVAATTSEAHLVAVQAWATAAWDAWRPWHETIRGLLGFPAP